MIKLSNINKKFKLNDLEIHVLKNISLEISKGEFVAIIGQSGSGKSTLMNIIGCLDPQSSGTYELNGRNIDNFSSDELANLRNEKFGFVFQRYNLIPSYNATQNVALPAIYSNSNEKERIQRAKELLFDLNLSKKINNFPNNLSGGEQQRVSIARALMNGGEIILADEPTGALDSKSGEKVMQIITDLHKNGHTIILVTHDMNVANYADRIIEIKDGEILKETIKDKKIYDFKEKIKPASKSALATFKNQFVESFKMSLNAIFSHKLRSFLTMIGIMIGVASVVCVVALGNGAEKSIIDSIKILGTNTIRILPGKNFGDMFSGKIQTLVTSDSTYLEGQPYVDYATPITSAIGSLTYKNKTLSADLVGGGVNSLKVVGINLSSGRNFTENDIKNGSSVGIIDYYTKETFFKNVDPVGKIIFFNKKPIKIIGATQKDNDSFFSGGSLLVYVPYTTILNKFTGNKKISSITLKIKDDINAQVAEQNIIKLLTNKHGTKDFFTRNSDTIKKSIEETTGAIRMLILAIAAISLVVGGIGVMNIMLISVAERTKEIGIRMAIGAKQSNIMQQFLIEAILLSIIGGIFGILIAYIFGLVFNRLTTEFSLIYSLPSIFIALIISSAIGIIFGFIPARNASRLNPIEALIKE